MKTRTAVVASLAAAVMAITGLSAQAQTFVHRENVQYMDHYRGDRFDYRFDRHERERMRMEELRRERERERMHDRWMRDHYGPRFYR